MQSVFGYDQEEPAAPIDVLNADDVFLHKQSKQSGVEGVWSKYKVAHRTTIVRIKIYTTTCAHGLIRLHPAAVN